MGMSASQMRYCMLTGRKSDVEYQGQQINQQRTSLATQSSAYNTQLLNLEVPTPPSPSDYTKTNYSFTMAGLSCSVSGTKYNSESGTYDINYTYKTTGDVASTAEATFYRNGANAATAIYTTGLNAGNSTPLQTAVLDKSATGYNSTIAANLSTIYGNHYDANRYSVTLPGSTTPTTLRGLDTSNETTAAALKTVFGTNYNSNNVYYSYTTGAGSAADPTVTHYMAASSISGGNATSYVAGTAATAGNGTAVTGLNNIGQDSYRYYQSGNTYRFVTLDQLDDIPDGSSTHLKYSYVQENSTIDREASMTGATVNWSDTGRMETIIAKDANGNTSTYNLTVTNETDNNAYTTAFNEYEYKKGRYDQEMEKINAQLEVIQSQDKKLELKLQDLDTQQKALSTEMDSVSKVIEKNVEKSFKTFA